MPCAGDVLRRSLIIWGWGDIALGDRRGWLLVLLQPLAAASLLLVAWQLIDGTRWLVVFVPLVLLVVFWVAQAVHAYRRALALGGAAGGELQLALFLPLVLAVFTAFWMLGGRHGSPSSTVEAYMDAWQANRPDLAVNLFPIGTWDSTAMATEWLAAQWNSDFNNISALVDQNLATYGSTSGLDSHHPFRSVRVEPTPQLATFAGPRPIRPAFEVEVVRTEQFQTMLLGLIPTTGERTVVIAPVLYIELDEEASPAGAWIPSTTWKVSGYFQIPLPTP